MTPAKIYPFSIPAGGSFPLLVIGDYAKILTSSGPLTLQGDTFGSIGPILAGQGVQDSHFRRLVLEDESGATNNGTILIADNAFIDDRITGEVSVIDGGKSRTLSGQVYGWRLNTPGVAANYNWGQIWNPAGSTRRMIVKSYSANVAAVAGINNIDITTPSGTIGSKLSGGAASGMLSRGVNSVSATPGGIVLTNQIIAGQYIVEPEPLVINPGFGFVLTTDLQNLNSSFTAHFVEEEIV